MYRYKKILDDKGSEKKVDVVLSNGSSLTKMDDICGAKASSLSRRQVNKRSRSQRDPRVVSTHIKDMSASKLSVGVSHTVDTAAFAAHDGTLNNTSSETDEDDVVIKDIGLKHKNNSQRSVDRKKQLKGHCANLVYRSLQMHAG
jgi:hypothetical protein